jgi:Domain of unknown function (DUF4157)
VGSKRIVSAPRHKTNFVSPPRPRGSGDAPGQADHFRASRRDTQGEAEADRAALALERSDTSAAGRSLPAIGPAQVSFETDSVPSSHAARVAEEGLAGSGQPLDPPLRTFMENGLGQDFSRVRVFTDAAADCAATRLGALAFTRGERIAFGAGQFAPGSREGRRLIGHELAHVAQQVRSGTKSLQRKADPDPAASGEKPDWDEAFRLADESRWEQVAELLTRFSAENLRYFIQTFKGQPEKISWLHRGALGNPKVGPDSPVARATLTVYLDVSFNEQAARSDWKRAAFFSECVQRHRHESAPR